MQISEQPEARNVAPQGSSIEYLLKKRETIQIRDPFVLPIVAEKKYYLFGTTDPDCWRGPGIGFDCYWSFDLEQWGGPIAAFRPEPSFWGTENFWAPEVHEYQGFFYMFASFKAPGHCRATHILVSERPEGPYRVHSPYPVTPPQWECLDGTLYVDDDGTPWLIFCHEWVQTVDGEIWAVRLRSDLREAKGDPILLFRGSEAPWTRPHRRKDGSCNPQSRVTDGPFVYRLQEGGLLLLWSSFGDSGYAMGCAHSATGILGPWLQEPLPLIATDGGHGMLFRSFEGELYLTFHSPNTTPAERFHYIPVVEREGTLSLLRNL
ncbi:MAG: glycoside hydrolase family 43 protein [Treponemataceae bacterium]|nr:glycoside hydrolase family 43 protein [Treponemataceae bacterium]